jgi:hypothetical protein
MAGKKLYAICAITTLFKNYRKSAEMLIHTIIFARLIEEKVFNQS